MRRVQSHYIDKDIASIDPPYCPLMAIAVVGAIRMSSAIDW